MIMASNSWEYPAHRPDEDREMNLVLDEIFSGSLEYGGSTRKDMVRARRTLYGNETQSGLREYLEVCMDACVGGILGCVEPDVDPIVHCRRLLNVVDILEKL